MKREKVGCLGNLIGGEGERKGRKTSKDIVVGATRMECFNNDIFYAFLGTCSSI